MSKFYTYNAWATKFQPIPNTVRNNGDLHYETYGDEVEYVRQQDERHIWTEVDGDSGTYIVAGYHFVNRIQYYITIVPWEDENTEVPSWVYRDCDCMDEDYEPKEDCQECEGNGTIDIPIYTKEDLIAIYGPEADIVE